MAYGVNQGLDIAQDNLVYRSNTGNMASGANPPGKLWIPIWSGEVIHAYDEYNKFEGMVDSKTISSGTTMEFPVTGTVSLKTAWAAGEELVGGENATATTFKVNLDKRPMAAHFELDNIDLMLTQWEYRTELARQAGMTLANARDKQIAAYIGRACAESKLTNDPRAVTPKDPFNSATAYQHFGVAASTATQQTDAALAVLKTIEDYMVYLQENNIPTEGVYMAITPQAFASIRSLGVARESLDLGGAYTVDIDGDHQAGGGARSPMFAGIAERGGLGGSLAARPYVEETLEYMGCTICKTMHGPFTDYTGAAIGETRYNLKFSGGGGADSTIVGSDSTSLVYAGTTKAIMWQRGCVASLSLQGVKVDNVDDIRRNTSFTVASMMAGTGTLRPECAVAIVDNSTTGANVDNRAKLREAWVMTQEYVDG